MVSGLTQFQQYIMRASLNHKADVISVLAIIYEETSKRNSFKISYIAVTWDGKNLRYRVVIHV